MTDLTTRLLTLAEVRADEYYGCGLDRLDPASVAWYADRVTEANLADMVDDLAAAAWEAY
jgi:hypothetical protein